MILSYTESNQAAFNRTTMYASARHVAFEIIMVGMDHHGKHGSSW